MLVLMCEAGGTRCVIRARDSAEVLPAVRLEPVPGAPDWLAGLFVFRGVPTPVLDLGVIIAGSPRSARWSSRIVLTERPGRDGSGLLGILVDRVTTAELDLPEPAESGAGLTGPGGLGPVLVDENGMIQFINLSRLVTPERQAVLFPSATDDTNG